MALRNAVIISTLIHGIFLYPMNTILLKKHIEIKKPIEIEYVVIKEPEKIKTVTQSMESRMMEARIQETPKVELKEDVKRIAPPKRVSQDMAKKDAQIKSTAEYIGYYHLIREKVRARLKENYVGYSTEGDVYLIFVLDSGGRLLEYAIEHSKSTGDKKLLDIAVTSLRQAAPFPAFPKGLSAPRMSFNLLVSFKRR